ncbi:unnamed protein product [Protopolystoma xenopodis]|uniref:Uncharacterized protein n=1 Tax=Protopolystoma xenopodis TaxID=117903 RepID=A0A3S5CS05_9PLAT|nr:unnamed protein product [Protopolystoma xenopodis]
MTKGHKIIVDGIGQLMLVRQHVPLPLPEPSRKERRSEILEMVADTAEYAHDSDDDVMPIEPVIYAKNLVSQPKYDGYHKIASSEAKFHVGIEGRRKASTNNLWYPNQVW